jgi:hypothetical protein
MRELVLSNGLITLVDEEDFYWLNQWRWHALVIKNKTYAIRSRKNNHLGLSSRAYLHRIIMRIEDPNIIIDHKDGDCLNNQKLNLRCCSKAENNRNTSSHKDSVSSYLGVTFNTEKHREKRWQAQLQHDGKRILSKRFLTEEEAAKAYDSCAKKTFGEFANLNFKN